MISLVGSTGFVGGNLACQASFDGLYHSTNIEEAFGTRPELLIYAGLRAEKFLAEKDPERDLQSILEAQTIISRIAPRQLVLISTVDVYADSFHATEETPASGQGAYGRNRARMEAWVKEQIPDHLIVRLPGLFGKGIKKNFIYDYIHYVPALLTPEKFDELSEKEPALKEWYERNERGFYACLPLTAADRKNLRAIFEGLGFSALQFTDSRGVFQYYHLAHLFDDISAALSHNKQILNLACEPVSISEIFTFLTGERFVNHLEKPVPHYDFRTLYAKEFGGFQAADGEGGYLYRKEDILNEIRSFTEKEMQL